MKTVCKYCFLKSLQRLFLLRVHKCRTSGSEVASSADGKYFYVFVRSDVNFRLNDNYLTTRGASLNSIVHAFLPIHMFCFTSRKAFVRHDWIS